MSLRFSRVYILKDHAIENFISIILWSRRWTKDIGFDTELKKKNWCNSNRWGIILAWHLIPFWNYLDLNWWFGLSRLEPIILKKRFVARLLLKLHFKRLQSTTVEYRISGWKVEGTLMTLCVQLSKPSLFINREWKLNITLLISRLVCFWCLKRSRQQLCDVHLYTCCFTCQMCQGTN